ncbi:transglutaminase-like cysteine peptidase [Vibrio lentus]
MQRSHLIILSIVMLCTLALKPAMSLHFSKSDIPVLVDKIKQHFGEKAHRRALDWITLVKESKDLPSGQQIVRVNDFFNQLRFIPDEKLWGQRDYWASIAEFIGAGGGDCEDFTLAKFYTLVYLGVAPKDMKLVYVNAVNYQEAHMVLAYFGSNTQGGTTRKTQEPLILDNLDKTIKKASQRPDLEPIYSFDTEEIWLTKQIGQGNRIGNATTIKPWVQVIKNTTEMKINTPILQLDEM